MTHRGTESPGERGAGPDRRRVLGLAGLGSALALLGACGREEEGPGMDGTTTPEAGACQEGATARQRSSGASDGGGAAKTAIDPSVVAHGALALSPDGTQLAAAAGLGAARSGTTSTAGTALWSTADGTVSARFDNALTGALAWHPDGTLLAVGGAEHIELTTPEGEVRWTLTGHGEPLQDSGRHLIQDLVFSADGELLVSLGADGTVRLWTGIGEAGCTPGQVLDTTAVRPLSIALSPDGRTLAVCGTAGAPQLWDVETSTLSSEVEGVEFAPRAVAYAADSTLLIGSGIPETSTTSSPERARLYALGADGTLEEGPVPEGLDVSSIAADPEGTRIAVTGRNERRVMIWDRGTGDREDLPDAPGGLDRLAWAPDGTTLHGLSPMHGVVSFDGTAWTTFDLP